MNYLTLVPASCRTGIGTSLRSRRRSISIRQGHQSQSCKKLHENQIPSSFHSADPNLPAVSWLAQGQIEQPDSCSVIAIHSRLFELTQHCLSSRVELPTMSTYDSVYISYQGSSMFHNCQASEEPVGRYHAKELQLKARPIFG